MIKNKIWLFFWLRSEENFLYAFKQMCDMTRYKFLKHNL